MKSAKKLFSLLLTVVMVLSLTVAASAKQEGNLTGGSITIQDAVPGQTYEAYQIMYLESYDASKGAYSYQANSAWEDWLATQTQYVLIDDQGYITWVENADAAAFAKAALAYAEATNIEADATENAPAAAEGQQYSAVEFDNLNLGYWLVDTSLGSLCSLGTTNPDVVMQEKNEVPTVTKEVQEDSDDSWGEKNTAEIGDTVNFRTTVSIQPGAANYALHDEMEAGLTLNPETIKVDGLTAGTDYTVFTTGLTDDCDFEIRFAKTYLDSITKSTDVIVSYSAVVNENAEIYTDANTNKTWLDYGDKLTPDRTPDSTTDTYTYTVDIVKTDSDNQVLDGAQFKLYDAETGGNEIAVAGSNGVYRLAKDGESGVAYMTTVDGKFTINGLDADTTYWLEETKAPDGYNKLPGRVEITFTKDGSGNYLNLSTTMNGDKWEAGDGGVHIVNKTGSLLPGTGGMGTTILYIIGGALVAGAGVTVAARKRVNSAK